MLILFHFRHLCLTVILLQRLRALRMPQANIAFSQRERRKHYGTLALINARRIHIEIRTNLFTYCTHANDVLYFIIFLSCSLLFSLSLRFNGHFPGEPGLAGVYWSKGWWRWWWQLDYLSYKSCKAPVKPSPPTNQHIQFVYRPDTLPTVSKHWKEINITFHGLAYPKLTWGSSNFVSDH